MSEEFDKRIGEKIGSRRKDRQLSIEQLAAKSGVDIGTISRTENGATQVTLESAVLLCRALQMTLTELIFETQENGVVPHLVEPDDAVLHRATDLTRSDAQALLELYSASRYVCIEMLVNWLNSIANRLKGDEPLPFNLDAQSVQLYLTKHDAFRFKVKYPEQFRIWAIETIYRLNGDLGNGDIPLLLSAVASDTERYQQLGRLGKDTIWRLQTARAERTRFSEVLKLAQELNIDFIGMYDNVEKLASNTISALEPELHYTDEVARLISLFVSICSWLRALGDDSESWLKNVRRDIEVRLATVEEVSAKSGD